VFGERMSARFLITIAYASAVASAAGGSAESAADRDPAKYVGVSTCSLCHNVKPVGDQFAKWQAGPHARAFDILGTPEARAVAARLGIANPQASGKCLKCHSTAYNWTEQIQTTTIKPEEGVVCESCHGPARGYVPKTDEELTLTKPLKPTSLTELFNPFARPDKTCITLITMEDRQKAIRAGLVFPAFKSCERCHNPESPTWKLDRYVNKEGKKVGFDLRQNFLKIAHPHPPPR